MANLETTVLVSFVAAVTTTATAENLGDVFRQTTWDRVLGT